MAVKSCGFQVNYQSSPNQPDCQALPNLHVCVWGGGGGGGGGAYNNYWHV